MTKSPYAMVRSATVIRGSTEGTPGATALEVEHIQDHGEDAVHDDDEDDRGDHGRRCCEAHGGGAPAGLHAPEAADERDQNTEHRALADADEEAGEAHGAAGLLEVLGGAETEHAQPDDRAAQDSEEVRVDREQRHH